MSGAYTVELCEWGQGNEGIHVVERDNGITVADVFNWVRRYLVRRNIRDAASREVVADVQSAAAA